MCETKIEPSEKMRIKNLEELILIKEVRYIGMNIFGCDVTYNGLYYFEANK